MEVIWIHGFGEDSFVWADFIDSIGSGYGHHLFDHSTFTDFSTIKEYAWKLRDFVLENEIQSPVLIGHSMGGYIALEYAAEFGHEISGLGLFHSSAAPDSDDKKADRRKTIEFIRNHGSEAFIKNFYPKMFGENFQNKALIENNTLRYMGLGNEALISATESMRNRNDHQETLSALTFPVFQILGSKDAFVPLKAGLEQAAKIQNPNVLVVANIAHAGMYERPKLCADFINSFLQNLK